MGGDGHRRAGRGQEGGRGRIPHHGLAGTPPPATCRVPVCLSLEKLFRKLRVSRALHLRAAGAARSGSPRPEGPDRAGAAPWPPLPFTSSPTSVTLGTGHQTSSSPIPAGGPVWVWVTGKEPSVCQSETGGVGAVLPPPRLESVTNTAGEGTRPASIREGDARGAGPTWMMSASFCSPAVLVNTPAPGEVACRALTPALQAGEAPTPAPALPAISQLSPTAKLHLLPNGGPRVERSVHSGRAARLPFPAARRAARQGQRLQGGRWNLKRGSMVT